MIKEIYIMNHRRHFIRWLWLFTNLFATIRDIQKEINQLENGGTIHLQPATYLWESVTLKDNVIISGAPSIVGVIDATK